jgi:wyosine [tRNA(Phe)-imidazoG37] synthetase (radical SAM superfamily)
MSATIAVQIVPQGLLVPRSALDEWLERGVEAIKEKERIIIQPRPPEPEEGLRQKQKRTALSLSSHETELLREINRGLSQEDWQRYHELVAKRRAETLTPEEQTALIALTDQIEEANVRRIERLIELARLRNTSLEALMDKLGITAPAYA